MTRQQGVILSKGFDAQQLRVFGIDDLLFVFYISDMVFTIIDQETSIQSNAFQKLGEFWEQFKFK